MLHLPARPATAHQVRPPPGRDHVRAAATAFAAGALLPAFAAFARGGRAAARTVTGSALALALGLLETAAGWSPTCVRAAVLLFPTRFATLCSDRAADHRGR
ncbi:hypothetical protein [Streptomyces sp. LN325]|uniref:hypothetical protein n=1 Tax=Streptomyces sp. LN325 TaxID=3112976 RepID=UPI00371E3616